VIGIALFFGGLVLRVYCVGHRDDPWASLRVAARICVMLGILVLIIPGNPPFGSLPRRRR
jgi:hypothetical protein